MLLEQSPFDTSGLMQPEEKQQGPVAELAQAREIQLTSHAARSQAAGSESILHFRGAVKVPESSL